MKLRNRPLTLLALLDSHLSESRLVAAGMSQQEAAAKGRRFASATQALLESGVQPDSSAMAIFVPGRIEVLGKHTDYCGGRSLLCTVERGLCFVAVGRSDRKIVFNALDMNESCQMQMMANLEPTKRHWSNYPMTAARRVARNFPDAAYGADIAMSSDLPAASGLSSSSAMIVGTFLVLSAINSISLDPTYLRNIQTTDDLAGYMGCIENGQSFRELRGDIGVGTFGGSQDHTAILCCKPNKLSVYSFCPVHHEQDVTFGDDLRFVIANSGVIAEKTGDALEKYNAVSDRASQLVTIWNKATCSPHTCLRQVLASSERSHTELSRFIDGATNENPLLRTRLHSRLRQFISESEQIIPRAVATLQSRDWMQLQPLVNLSQAGAEQDLQNQIPQTIALQRKLLDAGAIAASAFGAGFGGSVWGLFSDATLSGTAQVKLSQLPSTFVTRPGCGATEITDA